MLHSGTSITPSQWLEPEDSDMTNSKDSITITSTGVHIEDFDITNRDVAEFLEPFEPDQRPTELRHAVEVGVFCLNRANSSMDIEFIKGRVNEIINDLGVRMEDTTDKLGQELVKKLGSEDGQVLKPIVDLINQVAKATKERLIEVRDEIDPSKDTSSVGKAIKGFRDLLDPARKDSVQGTLEAAVTNITGENGELAKGVKTAVGDAIKPLKEEIDALAKEFRAKETAEEAVMQTIEKGDSFEEQLFQELRPWANALGADLRHVGTDKRSGDLLIVFSESSLAATDLRVVIEARDRQSPNARKGISDDLAKAMAERKANAAIYVSRSREGLGKEIGEFDRGVTEAGPWIAITHQYLRAALVLLVGEHKMLSKGDTGSDVDVAAVKDQIQRMQTSLKRVTSINRKITDVHNSADAIGTEARSIRFEINEALSSIEQAIRSLDNDSAASQEAA